MLELTGGSNWPELAVWGRWVELTTGYGWLELTGGSNWPELAAGGGWLVLTTGGDWVELVNMVDSAVVPLLKRASSRLESWRLSGSSVVGSRMDLEILLLLNMLELRLLLLLLRMLGLRLMLLLLLLLG